MGSAIDERINNFSAIILSDAQKMRSEIEKENERIRNEKVTVAKDEFLSEAYLKIQHSVSKIIKADNEKVLAAENAAKKELLKKREDIINSVFCEVESKIAEFMKTEEYEKWLKNKIEEAEKALGNGEKTVYVREEDIEIAKKAVSEISEKTDEITVEKINDKNFFGGTKIKNDVKNILADHSFDELIANARNGFLQKSGLIIG